MGGKSGGSGPIRFAPYLENNHSLLLSNLETIKPEMCFYDALNSAFATEGSPGPWSGITIPEADEGFLGDLTVLEFPSLFDMFGKFMAGLDIEVLWTQSYRALTAGPEISDATANFAANLERETDEKVMPGYLAGMRDINSVMSTAFVNGKAIIASGKVRAIGDFATKLEITAWQMTSERWAKHLDWNRVVIDTYKDMQRVYYAAKMDTTNMHAEFGLKERTYNMQLFDSARGILGALNAAPGAPEVKGPSQAAKSISMTAAGAGIGAYMAAGTSVGGPVGAVIGGVIGLAMSFAS